MIFFFLELNLNILYYYTSVWSTVTVLDLLYRCFNSHLPYLDIVQLPDQTLLHQVHHLVLSDPLLPQSQAFVRHPGRLAGLAVGLLQLGLDLNMEVSAGQWRSVQVSAGQCRSMEVSAGQSALLFTSAKVCFSSSQRPSSFSTSSVQNIVSSAVQSYLVFN